MKFRLLLFFLVLLVYKINAKLSEDELRKYLQDTYEKEASNLCYKSASASFDFVTDIKNKAKEDIVKNVTLELAAWRKDVWKKYFQDANEIDYKDPAIQRQVKSLKLLGTDALDQDKLLQLTNVKNKLEEIYSTAKICPYKNQNCDISKEGLSLEPDIEAIMSNSSDYDELKYVWKAWRDNTGVKMRELYKTYVDLSNEAARANNFSDYGAYWRYSYEDPNLVQTLENIWNQVKPLYDELHTYVGRKLKQKYGDKLDISDGLIPAHVFGNMWAQTWTNLGNLVRPYPDVANVDINAVFKEKNYTVLDLMRLSDEFYQSMGLESMSSCYDESAGAMINKPTDGREVLCHASAWDFCDGHTYRLKMCTQVDFDDFVVIHHEMGHIQYFQQYRNQPVSFRDGANPGFHEAIGDTIALSVVTPQHLQKIGLLKDVTDNHETEINSLMAGALERVAFLPFGLLIDKWRWDVFNKTVTEEKWNSHWWDYRKKYQKVKPPVERSDTIDFDPGAKYHVPGSSQYIAYYLARIYQFQFYKSLCIAAGQYDPKTKSPPLHQCDFYQSKAAGDKLRSALLLGASKHWSETLEILTGSKNIDAQPLLDYFDPLYEWLKKENKNNS